MEFQHSERCLEFKARLEAFMDEHVYPAEEVYHQQVADSGDPHHHPAVMEELKSTARSVGLWNLFLPDERDGAGLSNSDYAPLAEIMGGSPIASEVFNCSAPDTGNMEVLHLFATDEQRERWLVPLLEGEIRSSFAMTEPAVASSDAANIEMSIVRDGDEYVLNGRKWWTSNAYHPNCRVMIAMGKTDADGPPHRQQSMVLVPLDTPGVTVDAQPHRVRLRRSGGPRRSRLQRRPRSGVEPDRRRGRRLHDRSGAAGAGTNPSLHARDRCGGARARGDVRTRGAAHDFRAPDRHARQHPGLDRRVADRNRDGAPA